MMPLSKRWPLRCLSRFCAQNMLLHFWDIFGGTKGIFCQQFSARWNSLKVGWNKDSSSPNIVTAYIIWNAVFIPIYLVLRTKAATYIIVRILLEYEFWYHSLNLYVQIIFKNLS